MKMMPSVRLLVPVFTGPMLLISAAVFAQEAPSDCVEMGAMAYDNWTMADSGGSGALPDGVGSADYIRCKACHGWDRMGTGGGYVRRSRTSSRPNAGAGSWVALDETHSASNKAAHANGYTLGNQHPDFSVDGPTETQTGCLAEFLNFADANPGMYFSSVNPGQDPVLYTIVDTADAAAGETFFNISPSPKGC